MSFVGRLHTDCIQGRRVRVFSNLLTDFIPQYAQVLDVGSGDGLVAHLIMQSRPDIKIRGGLTSQSTVAPKMFRWRSQIRRGNLAIAVI
jgi:hypothetical protein